MSDFEQYVTCEICKKSVKLKNKKRHLRKIHGQVKRNKVQRGALQTTVTKPEVQSITRRRQVLFSKINQGIYDSRQKLLNLMKNAERLNEIHILKAVQQRLKKKFPTLYRRYVGPLELRQPLGSTKCYCAIPSSIDSIANDIMNHTIPSEALQCDACWDIDISYAWGVYGQWGAKIIETQDWRAICELRGDKKYATA